MTPHIEAKKEEIKETVIMPGDPLRAKFIAENYLEDYKLINSVRGMLGYTGTYKGKEVTVMASGMGMPSIGIYSYELYSEYDVKNIIRIGTCGSYLEDVKIYDIILTDSCYSESSYAKTQNGSEDNILYPSTYLNNKLLESAKNLNFDIKIGCVHSTDVFSKYKENDNFKELIQKYNCIVTEMESFALFHNARVLNKNASCILTVSDNLVTYEETNSIEREKNLLKMIEIALNAI